MNAGKLDRIALLTAAVKTRAANGSVTESWVEAGSFYVSIVPLSGRTAFLSARESAQIESVFEARYRENVRPTMRLSVNGNTYEITRVDEIGRKDGIRIFGRVRVLT